MRDRWLINGGVERRDILPRHTRDRRDLVPLPTEELLRLGNRLQIDIEAQSGCVIQNDLEAIGGLRGSCSLGMPDRGQRVPDIALGDLGDGHASKFGQHVMFQRAIPSSRSPVPLEIGFAAFEGVQCDIFEDMAVAHGVSALLAPMFDGVVAFDDQSPIFRGELPSVLQGKSL